MVDTAEKKRISDIIEVVKEITFSEMKEERSEEEIINSFLDRINDLKSFLRKSSEIIDGISEQIITISWFTDLSEETLKEISHLIILAKNLRNALIRKYVSLNTFRVNEIAKEEITAFKNTIDFLTESYTDLESIFFTLPKNDDFLEITKRLSA